MKETIALVILLITLSAVVIIQVVKTGTTPPWFESSILPLIVAALMSIKFGVERSISIRIEKDKNETDSTNK